MSGALPVSRSRALRMLLVTVATLASAAGCTVSGSSADCPDRVTYEGHTYQGVTNADVDFTVGEKLGTATSLPCNDTSTSEELPTESTAYRVEGLDPDVAIAVGSAPEDVLLVAAGSGQSLPPEVEKLIDRP